MNELSKAIEATIAELKELEDDDRPGRLYTLRRKLEYGLFDYIKQGNRIPVVNKFKILCRDCGNTQLREEDYYLHLRKDHNVTDQEAAIEANRPRTEHDEQIQQLSDLLEQFTDFQLEEKCYG